MSEDRRAPKGYHPEADLLWEVGRQAELYVLDVLEALKAGNVEVKADNRERATGRVFIEYACQWHDGVWHESGVYETAAEVWVFVLRSSLLVAAPVSGSPRHDPPHRRQGSTGRPRLGHRRKAGGAGQ